MIVRNDSIIEGSISELADYQEVYGAVFAKALDNIDDSWAYSLRKIRTNYSGNAIRVRRASDNTETNIGFDGNGDLDLITLGSFCSGTNGFVTTFYDQGTNGLNMTQTTTSAQPKIYDSSSGVITNNSKPALYFNGSAYTMKIANLPLSAWFSFYHVGKYSTDFFFEHGPNAGSSDGFWLYGSTEQVVQLRRSGAAELFDRNTPGNWTGTNTTMFFLLFNDQNNGGQGRIWKNFVQLTLDKNSTTSAISDTAVTADMNILSRNQSSLFGTGYLHEIVFFDNDREGDRISLTNNVLTYYGLQ
jgi:hypothetical protein